MSAVGPTPTVVAAEWNGRCGETSMHSTLRPVSRVS